MTTPLVEKLENDIRAHVLATLPHRPSKRPELEAKTTSDLLITYCNWRLRSVPVRPRAVVQSPDLLRNPLSTGPQYGPGLQTLIDAITAGADLTPYLSERIQIGFETPKAGKYHKRKDLDLLLFDWHVHHLHLSTAVKLNGFMERTTMLLFVAFMGDAALLINIYDHDSWTREEIATILIDNWPDSDFVHEFKGAIGLERQHSDDDRAVLRNNGIVSLIEWRGKVYMMGYGGISSAGTSNWATRHADWILRSLRAFDNHITAYPDYIAETLKLNNLPVPAVPEFDFVFMRNEQYGIREKISTAIFPLPK